MRRILTALVFVLASCVNAQAQSAGDSRHADEVSLKVETSKPTYSVGEDFGFSITVRNDGPEKFLYGGEALGRTRMWTAFECGFVDEKRREIRLGLTWGVAAVAGRIDPFAIRLDSGETYVLNVTPNDYLFFDYRPAGVNNLARHLPAGRYQLRCAYKSERHIEGKSLAVWEGDKFLQLWERLPESVPKTWEGSAASNEYSFRVVRQK
jgi:hypothetical protein